MSTQSAKVVLVTGSSSGIGESIVKLFAEKGYQVVIQGTNKGKVEQVAIECAKLSPNKLEPLCLVADFQDAINGEVVVQKTLDKFNRLDVLVNNAGIFKQVPLASPDAYSQYRDIMTVNTDATVRATMAAVDALKEAKGTLLFVSSVASVKPTMGGFSYCMSKAAMSIFAKCMALELAPHVRVNIVSPGPVKTPIFERAGYNIEQLSQIMSATTLVERIGTPEEIARSVYYLAADESSFITGHELFIDGGYLIKQNFTSAAMQMKSLKKSD